MSRITIELNVGMFEEAEGGLFFIVKNSQIIDMTDTATAKKNVKTNHWSGGLVWGAVIAFIILAFVFIGSATPTLNSIFRTYNLSGATEPQTELYFSQPDQLARHQSSFQITVNNRENTETDYAYRLLKTDGITNAQTVLDAGNFSLANEQKKQIAFTLNPTSQDGKSKITVELKFSRKNPLTASQQQIVQTIHFWIEGKAL